VGGNEMKFYIGVDIGGTKIAIVKGNEHGEVLKKVRFLNDRKKVFLLFDMYG
jgi:predicted NBD/HSP70 family sugar kinase